MTSEATYERFTDRARKVMRLANLEAQRSNHECVGTEHVLLGLIREGSGVAANVLKDLGVDLHKARCEVEKLVQSDPYMVTMGKLLQPPRVKKVVEYSMEEARNLYHDYVGTEHILLGLLREQGGVAAQVLINLGLKLEEIRGEVLNLLGYYQSEDREMTHEGDGEVPRVVWRLELKASDKQYHLIGIYSTRQRALDEAGNEAGYVVRGTVLDEPIVCLAREGVYRITE